VMSSSENRRFSDRPRAGDRFGIDVESDNLGAFLSGVHREAPSRNRSREPHAVEPWALSKALPGRIPLLVHVSKCASVAIGTFASGMFEDYAPARRSREAVATAWVGSVGPDEYGRVCAP